MSTLTTSVRKSVSGHWLLTAIAAVVVIAALVTALVVAMTGSSSGSKSTSPTIGGSGTSQSDNSFCQGTNKAQFGAC
jgi:hypothetical protein